MKRILISTVLLLTLSFIGFKVSATEVEDSNGALHITFIRNVISNDKVNFIVSGNGSADDDYNITQNDVVVRASIPVASDSSDTISVTPALDNNGEADTNNKLSYGGSELTFDVDDIKGSGEKHIIFYENAKNKEYVTSSTNTNNYLMFVMYYATSYEENLGVHSWGWESKYNSSPWGDPLLVFKTVGRTPDGNEIKGALLESSTADAGCIVYAGSDDNKKHADYGNLVFNKDVNVFEPQLTAVSNKSVFINDEEFSSLVNEFKLRFIPFGTAKNGSYEGTYATTNKNVLVSLSSAIVIDKEDEDGEILTSAQRLELIKNRFTIYETDEIENVIEFNDVDYNIAADSALDFVFTLEDTLDLDTSYTIKYTYDGVECEIEINMDREAPVIDLLRSNDVIEIKWGQPFDMAKFPQYEATDDRDGDITSKVFVPVGMGIVNTSIEGEYKVTLRVIDSWGNITDKVITFIVKK